MQLQGPSNKISFPGLTHKLTAARITQRQGETDRRETQGSREDTQHSWKRMLWLAAVYVHIWLTQVFFQHALIVNIDLFSFSPVSRNYPRTGLLEQHLPGALLPWTQSYSKPGEASASKGLETWDQELEYWLIHLPRANRPGSNRTQQTLQEHLPAVLQSQQSLLNIRHPQKPSLEIKSKQV